MIIKNNSQKVIGIGTTSILPDQTAECPKGYENNPIVQKFISEGTFTVVKEAKKPQKPQKQDTSGKANDLGQADNSMNADDMQKQDGSGENGDPGAIDADGKTDSPGKADETKRTGKDGK